MQTNRCVPDHVTVREEKPKETNMRWKECSELLGFFSVDCFDILTLVLFILGDYTEPADSAGFDLTSSAGNA